MNPNYALAVLCSLIHTEALFQIHSDEALAPLNRYWFWLWEFGGANE